MQARHPLGILINAVQSANGWSDTDVAKRSESRGFTLSKSNISRLRNEPVVSVKGETIRALAAGLGISASDIAQAALASMNIPVTQVSSTDAESAIKRDLSLSDRDRRTLLRILEGIREDSRGSEPGVASIAGRRAITYGGVVEPSGIRAARSPQREPNGVRRRREQDEAAETSHSEGDH